MKPLLCCTGVKWDVQVDILGGTGSSFEYSGFVLRKAAPLVAESADVKTVD